MPPLRERTFINGPLFLASAGSGAALGVAAHQIAPETFSWWFVPAAAFALFMALAAYVRRHRWEERSAATAMGAIAVALTFVGQSAWFWFCTLLVFAAYWWLLVLADMRRRP